MHCFIKQSLKCFVVKEKSLRTKKVSNVECMRVSSRISVFCLGVLEKPRFQGLGIRGQRLKYQTTGASSHITSQTTQATPLCMYKACVCEECPVTECKNFLFAFNELIKYTAYLLPPSSTRSSAHDITVRYLH